ncbi:UNVERIFIED_CONTAM: hypothetical protein FKN15_045170 [Acipenser sinensis]
MQAHELLRQLRLPEFGEVRQYVQTLPTNTLMGFGAFAALTTYWYATRPKALKPPCDLALQSVEIEVCKAYQYVQTLPTNTLMGFGAFAALTTYWYATRPKALKPPCDLALQSVELETSCGFNTIIRNPKGAMLTHANIVSNAAAFIKITKNQHVLTPEDVMISFLPLAHMFERVVETSYCISSSDTHVSYLPLAHMFERLVQVLLLCHGARIGFFQGDIRLLMDDLKMLQPTVFPVVPRLLNRMFDRIFGQANTPLKRWLLDFATKRKEAELKSGIVRNDSVWDKLIFSKVQASLGGKVQLMITGAAPVSPTVLSFLRAALGCQVLLLCHGARIGFFQGDIRLLMDDLKMLQPTVFPVVPRLLNRMFDRIFGQANTPLKRWLLDFATKRKEAELKSGIVRNDSVWDKLIFSKVQASLGGKVQLMITGAAPVSPTVLSFLRAALGCQFYEGYGQTECTAGCSMTLPGDWTAGKIHQHTICTDKVDPEIQYLASICFALIFVSFLCTFQDSKTCYRCCSVFIFKSISLYQSSVLIFIKPFGRVGLLYAQTCKYSCLT